MIVGAGAVPSLKLEPTSTAAVEPLLTAEQVARILGVRAKRVYELGIPAVRISERAIRWRRQDVIDWIEARRTT